MKRVLSVVLMLLMLAGLTVPAFAAPGAFLESPSKRPVPEVVDFEPIGGHECNAKLVITPYVDRSTLSSFLRELIEDAYVEIVNSRDLATLNSDLAELANTLKVDTKDLAVSNLFDMHVVGCDEKCDHTGFRVVIRTEEIDSFVGMLHMDHDGVWELVGDVNSVNAANEIEIVVNAMSPFAIVVDTDPSQPPQTGDSSLINIYAIVMSVSALGAVGIFVFTKKRRI